MQPDAEFWPDELFLNQLMVSFDKQEEVGITATALGQSTDRFLLARHFECVSLGISDSQHLYTRCILGTAFSRILMNHS